MNDSTMKFGLTQRFDCSYLDDQQEQLLVFVDEQQAVNQHYELLIGAGFRRSGEQIYRPHCPKCQACQSIRIPVEQFAPSKSQKRILKRNQDIEIRVSRENKPEYYQLYEQYINQRHSDGSMYPASEQQYFSFVGSQWNVPLFIEFYLEQRLIAVAVTDELEHALSALYTFFAPELSQRSMGTLAILNQIRLSQQMNKAFLYLGYQVDACAKMNYKSKFFPHQRFFANKWQQISKKTN